MFKIIPVENEIKKLDIEELNKNEDRTKNKLFNLYHLRCLVCGSSGSGKTTWILNYIFQNMESYKLILYLAPTETLNSGFIKTIIDKKILDKYIYFIDIRKDKLPTISELQELYKQISQRRASEKSPRIALILDDFINVLTSKDDRKQINAYLTQLSRANCDLFLLVQTYNHITPSIATNINMMVLFTKYMSRDSFNTCIRRSFTGEYNKKIGDEIYNTLRHINQHEPFIFINDQPIDKSIIYNNYYLDFYGESSSNDELASSQQEETEEDI